MGCLGLGGENESGVSVINPASKLSISGRVYFSELQLYGNIPINIKNFQKEVVAVTTTDSSGYYSISGLTPGIYHISAATGESEITFANSIQVTDQGCTEIRPISLLCVKDVVIDQIGSESFHIDFHTNRSCMAALEYGPTGGYMKPKFIGQGGKTHHEATITGLKILTEYEISLHLTGDDGQELVMHGLAACTTGLAGCQNLSVNINEGNYETSNRTVTLNLKADNCTEMRISESYTMDDANWVSYSPIYTHTFSNSSSGIKRVFVQFKNREGTISPIQSDSIIYNTSGYIGIWINDGEVITNQSMVTIKAVYPNASNMILSDSPSFANAFWESYSPVRQWNLTGEDGVKNIYCKFKGGKANSEEVFKASIIYDTTPSAVEIVINNGSMVTSSTTVDLRFDYSSVPSYMKVSNSVSPSEDMDWSPFQKNIKWTLPTGEGNKTVYAVFKDSANNQYGPISAVITLDTIPPDGNSIQVLETSESNSAVATFSLIKMLPKYLHFNIADTSTHKVHYSIGQATTTIPTEYFVLSAPFEPIELDTNNLSLGDNKAWVYFTDEAGNKSVVQTTKLRVEGPELEVLPQISKLKSGETKKFAATIKNISTEEVGSITWAIIEGPGIVDEDGIYTAPSPLFENAKVKIRGSSSLLAGLYNDATIELITSPEIVYIDSNGLQTKEPLSTQLPPTDTASFQIYLLHNANGIKLTSLPSIGIATVSVPIKAEYGSIATITYNPPIDFEDTKTVSIGFCSVDDPKVSGKIECTVSTGPSITIAKSSEIAQRSNPITLTANIANTDLTTVTWTITPATTGSFSSVNHNALIATTISPKHEVKFYPATFNKITRATITATIGTAKKAVNITIYPPIGITMDPAVSYAMPIPTPMELRVSSMEYLIAGTNEDLIWEFKNESSEDFMAADGRNYTDRGSLTVLENNKVQYLRPSKLPSSIDSSVSDNVIIRATSVADPLSSSTAIITLAPPVVVEVFDNVEKTNKVTKAATVIEVGSLQFYAKVTPEMIGNTTVKWSLSGASTNIGEVDANGKYVAPSTIDTNKVFLRATSNYDAKSYAEVEISLSEFWVPKRDNLIDSSTGEPMPISTVFVDPNTKSGEPFIVFAGTSAENKFGYYGLWVATFSDDIGDTSGGYWVGVENLYSSTKNPQEKYLIHTMCMANDRSVYVSTGDGLYYVSKKSAGIQYKAEKCVAQTPKMTKEIEDAYPFFAIDTRVYDRKTELIVGCPKGIYLLTLANGSKTDISEVKLLIDTQTPYTSPSELETRTAKSGETEVNETAYPNTVAENPIKSVVRSVKYDSLNKSLYFGTASSNMYYSSTLAYNMFLRKGVKVFAASTGIDTYIADIYIYPDKNYPQNGSLPGIPMAIAIDPINTNTVWAATTSGVCRSTNYGSSWSTLSFGGGTTTNCRAIIVDPNNTINVMAGSEDGLYRSIDGGSKWTRIRSGLGNYKTITSLAQGSGAASQRRKVWVGTSGGVFIGKQSLALE